MTESVSLIWMAKGGGYAARIRHLKEMPFSMSPENFMSRMMPLLQLACNAKSIMEDTYQLYEQTPIPLAMSTLKKPTTLLYSRISLRLIPQARRINAKSEIKYMFNVLWHFLFQVRKWFKKNILFLYWSLGEQYASVWTDVALFKRKANFGGTAFLIGLIQETFL